MDLRCTPESKRQGNPGRYNVRTGERAGLGTSQRMICSPRENFVMGVDTIGDYNLDVQKFNRSIKILIDLKAGVNFKEIHARALAVNDQA